jgi:hypothetical protein
MTAVAGQEERVTLDKTPKRGQGNRELLGSHSLQDYEPVVS